MIEDVSVKTIDPMEMLNSLKIVMGNELLELNTGEDGEHLILFLRTRKKMKRKM